MASALRLPATRKRPPPPRRHHPASPARRGLAPGRVMAGHLCEMAVHHGPRGPSDAAQPSAQDAAGTRTGAGRSTQQRAAQRVESDSHSELESDDASQDEGGHANSTRGSAERDPRRGVSDSEEPSQDGLPWPLQTYSVILVQQNCLWLSLRVVPESRGTQD